MKKQSTKEKVFVGLSGGVDSSVSAALLQSAGYAVTGVFIKVWHPEFLPCNWKQDRLDAMRVCAHLGIPFLTMDLEKEYKKEVVDYMVHEYKNGRTPNPDVMCNRYVKFGAFFKKAREMGADYVATGHYAQVLEAKLPKLGSLASKKLKDKSYQLEAGLDSNKDQSYFLWTLGQEQLAHTFFPVGHLQKPKVRTLAKKFGLITAEKKDSQGLCFIGKIDLKDFLNHYIPEKKGNVLSGDGKKIGTHSGAFFYTLGQRHGFTITKKTPNDTPFYIISKNIKRNTLTVSQKLPENNLLANTKKIILRDTNWIWEIPSTKKQYSGRIRYRQVLQGCKVTPLSKNTAEVIFKKPQQAVSIGQSFVLYNKEECLGGGVIDLVK